MKEDSNKTLKILYLAKRLVFVTIIIYIVVFFVVNSSYLSKDNISRVTYTIRKTLTESYAEGMEKKISLMYDERESEIVFKDGFAVLSTGTLSIYSSDFIRFSSHKIGYRQPVLLNSSENIFCFDRGGNSISVYDSFNKVNEKTFENSIINVAVSESGYVAVITEAYGYKGMVTILDKDLKEIMQWYSADYYLLYLGFTQKNTVSVITVVPNKENIDTYVINLNYKTGEERSVICAENRFPLDVYVKHDNTLEIVSDTDIISLREDEYSSNYRYGSAEIYTYRQFDEYCAIISLTDSVKQIYRLTVVDTDGNIKFERIVESYKDIQFFNGYFFILSDSKITTVGVGGQEVGLTEVDPDVYKILVSRGFALFIKPEQLNIINSAELFEYSAQ